MVRHIHAEGAFSHRRQEDHGIRTGGTAGMGVSGRGLLPNWRGGGLIGMWKAFEELEQLGWVKPGKRPRMIAIQASGCAPVVRAYNAGASVCQMWQNASTFAAGLRVPKPYGDTMMLDILRASDGVALALTDEEILASILDWARNEGILLSPEGAAATAAYDRLLASGVLN